MEKTQTKSRRSLWILVLFILAAFALCLWLYLRAPTKSVTLPAAATREIILTFAPSQDADENALNVMKAAAVRICDDAQAIPDTRVTLLSWKAGVPPGGPSYNSLALSDSDALKDALERAQIGGSLSLALQAAKALSDADDNPDRTVILLTDRAPADGEELDEGPYDSQDSALYRYANAASQAAAELCTQDSLSVVAFPQSVSGRDFDFTRRFLNDIQTAGYYEILNAAGLDAFREIVSSDLLAERGARKLIFRYPHGKDRSAVCYYSDDYFSPSAYDYNQSLATMSLSFAMSAFASEEQNRYANKSVNARNLLKEIGVADSAIGVNEWFTLRPETDSIGAVAGSKPISVNGEDFTLIAVAIRGGGYGREWASNFTLGASGQHTGFDDAKNKVLTYLKTYLAEQKISGPVKFWVTGFSRAAATANLIGGELDKGYDFGAAISYRPEDVYAYCFEPPAGALVSETRNQEIYYNIFNIVNQSDPVPFVAPSPLGFGRYGIDRFLPSAQSSSRYLDERAAMLRIYNAMEGVASYSVDDFRMKKLNLANLLSKETLIEDDSRNRYSQGVYLSNYVAALSKEFLKDRENYVERYQDGIREVCSILFGCSDEQQRKIADSLTKQAREQWANVVAAYFNPLTDNAEAFSLVSDWLVNAVNEAGVTDYDEPTLRNAGAVLSDLLVNLLIQRPNDATTLAANLGGIAQAHSWELCYAWMASMDPNYKRGAETSLNSGTYRIVRVNCDVDVSVRNADGELVAQIVNDDPKEIRGSGIISAINENGEKIVILPADSAYQIAVTRRDADGGASDNGATSGNADADNSATSGNGATSADTSGNNGAASGNADGASLLGTSPESVNVSVDEYSARNANITRGVDYFEIPLASGETLNADIPSYAPDEIASGAPDGSQSAYALADSDGNDVQSDSDLSGADAANASYVITAAPDDETRGMVIGGGTFGYGDFAQLEATPHDGYAFDCWRIGDGIVSNDPVYRFGVTENVNFTAHFAESPPDSDALRALAFSDVSQRSYCFDAVTWAVKTGVAGGTTDTTFSPSEPCTAAQAVTFLWRAAGSPAPSNPQSPFTDLDPDAYYYHAVLWAAEHDITMGTSQTTFSPDKTVSRSQFITLLYRTFGDYRRTAVNPFSDVPNDAYYRDAVAWAYETGVTRGVTSTAFQPLRSCDRAQIVTFLYRFFVR